MKNRIFIAAATALILSLSGAANAAFIEGEITMSGAFTPTGGNDLGDATGIDFDGGFAIHDANGDFALAGISVGDNGVYADFDFINPLVAPLGPLWSIGGFSFALEEIAIVFQSSAFLVLQGSGTISAAGFDDTNAMWSLTANSAGTLFNFSSGATVDEPSVLALIGLGLLGLRLRRRVAS